MVTLTIDKKTVTVPDGTTILEAARTAKIDIPTDYTNPVVRIENRCVKCMRCIQV